MRSSRFVTLESDAGKKWFPKKTFLEWKLHNL